MKPIYLRKESNDITRKIMMDMAYLVSHKKIRLPKWLYEEGLYFLYIENSSVNKYFLDRNKVVKEDEFHYYFNIPFKDKQLEDAEV